MRSARTRTIRSMTVAAVAAGLLAGGITATTSGAFTTDTATGKATDTVANAAAAQKQSKKQNRDCLTGRLEIRNKKFVKTVYEWPDDPAHVTSIPGPGKKIFEYKIEVSNKVSATFGMTDKAISTGLGFEINKTRSFADRVEIDLKDKARYLVRAGMVYKQYRYDVYEQRGKYHWWSPTAAACIPGKNSWVKKGTGTAMRAWTDTYKYTKVTKPKTRHMSAPAQLTSAPSR
ncbi:hypothetical protein ACFW2D_17575 [Streptomyces sp. NPDC058914]|uniref:hypothetical protein n=1 Tax=Streptomyces sp. NPDC058914 TaxID=3346671 RepID=UPI0036C0C787